MISADKSLHVWNFFFFFLRQSCFWTRLLTRFWFHFQWNSNFFSHRGVQVKTRRRSHCADLSCPSLRDQHQMSRRAAASLSLPVWWWVPLQCRHLLSLRPLRRIYLLVSFVNCSAFWRRCFSEQSGLFWVALLSLLFSLWTSPDPTTHLSHIPPLVPFCSSGEAVIQVAVSTLAERPCCFVWICHGHRLYCVDYSLAVRTNWRRRKCCMQLKRPRKLRTASPPAAQNSCILLWPLPCSQLIWPLVSFQLNMGFRLLCKTLKCWNCHAFCRCPAHEDRHILPWWWSAETTRARSEESHCQTTEKEKR